MGDAADEMIDWEEAQSVSKRALARKCASRNCAASKWRIQDFGHLWKCESCGATHDD